MSSNIFEADLLQSLPAVLKNDETTFALACAIAKELHALLNQTPMATLYPCIDTLPEEVLDVIAHDFKVDWYDYDYTLEPQAAGDQSRRGDGYLRHLSADHRTGVV